MLAEQPRAFNANRPGGGSGLVQPVFRSPARVPAWVSSRGESCAPPPSEKRSSLSCLTLEEGGVPTPQGGKATLAWRSPDAACHLIRKNLRQIVFRITVSAPEESRTRHSLHLWT